MNLTEMIRALRIELKDPDETLWSTDEMNRAVDRAVTDVDRFFPQETFKEITFKSSVVGESWTAGDTAGVWKQLANKPIAEGSEVVKDAAAATCARDTDYFIDYISGKITHITGGNISNNEACTISYGKSKLAIDVSALSIIRVQRIEYPYGRVPQQFSSYDLFGSLLWLTGVEAEQQAKLVDGKHIVIHYLTQNILPTPDSDGSYPRHLDGIVLKGGAAYCCFIKALQYEHQAAIDLASARVSLGNIAGVHTKIETALGAARTLLSGTSTDLTSARSELAAISHTAIGTALADTRTSISSALTKLGLVDAYLVGATAPSAKVYLDTGDGYIITLNDADDVPGNFAAYAQRCSELAMGIVRQAGEYNTAAGNYTAEANSRIVEIDRYIAEAREYISIAVQNTGAAGAYQTEATALLAEIVRYIDEASNYTSIATQHLALAERFRAEGSDRRAEFLSVLVDRAQLSGRTVVTTSPRQIRT